MNIRKMKKYIKKYGIIRSEYKRPKDMDEGSIYFGKESYYVFFYSESLNIYVSCGHSSRSKAYKAIIYDIRKELYRNNVDKLRAMKRCFHRRR